MRVGNWRLEVGSFLVEVSQVRRRVQHAIAEAKQRTQDRRQRLLEAEQAYALFLQDVATPLVRQVANALKAEGYAFTVSTPGDGLRLASDRGRDDFVEFTLDADGDPPQVIGRISRTRGSRRIDQELPLNAGVSPGALTEDDVLDFVMRAVEPWLAR